MDNDRVIGDMELRIDGLMGFGNGLKERSPNPESHSVKRKKYPVRGKMKRSHRFIYGKERNKRF
jgi:hypothetical protein